MQIEMIEVHWLKGPSAGFVDLLPRSLFETEGVEEAVDHVITGDRQSSFAICKVSVQGSTAWLDYGGDYAPVNESNDLYVGILRLNFADESRRLVASADWLTEGKGDWELNEPVNFVYSSRDVDETPLTDDLRTRTVSEVYVREGQRAFRKALLDAYDRRCALTDFDVEATLEAAHIVPYTGTHSNRLSNGLILRADLHRLFDLGLWWVDESSVARFSDKLPADSYLDCRDKPIRAPVRPSAHPDPEALKHHRARFGRD
jgi:hypothetical protein